MTRRKRNTVRKIEYKLKRLYLNPKEKTSFGGKSEFKKNLKSKQEKKLVENVLPKIPAYTLHRKAVTKFKRRKVFIPSIDNQWVADLLEIGKYARYNKGYRYLLNILDGFSRFAWVEPIKNKQSSTVAQAFTRVLDRAHPRKPVHIQFDLGKEFIGRPFQNLLKANNIKSFSVHSEIKACLIEAFNKTLFTKIARYMTFKKTKTFIDVLPQFVENYNNSYHKGIKATPSSVCKENEDKIFQNQYGNLSFSATRGRRFEIGDKVLIAKIRGLFEKGHSTHFKPEPFYIDRIKDSEPRMYYLRDCASEPILGGFYEQQLLHHVLSD